MKVPPAHFLEKMSEADRRKYFPGAAGLTPDECHHVAVAKSEKELQGQLEGLLRRNLILPTRQRMDRHSNIAVGMPDIWFAVHGRACFWEVKMPGEKPNADQFKMIIALQKPPMSAHVRVIRSYQEGIDDIRFLLSLPEVTAPDSPNGPEVPA